MTEIKAEAADRIQLDIYSKMSCAKKWESVCQLRETAWKLKAAGIRDKHLDWNDHEIQAEVRKIFLYATT